MWRNFSTWQKNSPQAPPVMPVTNIRYAHASTRLLLYTLPFAFFVFQTEFLYFVKSKVYAGDVTCQFGQFFFFLSSNINSIAAFLSPVNATLRNSFHTVARQFHLINHTYTNLQHTVLQIQVRIQDTFLKIQIQVKIQETIIQMKTQIKIQETILSLRRKICIFLYHDIRRL